ncbi:MAG: helix-turn-helix domain-containing protein [Bacteroidales bacterium]|nr:helix-turn-helix domain-containing protein [Bacteroidales bacterium]
MSNFLTISQVISKLREHYSFSSDRKLAKHLGVAESSLNTWKTRNHWNDTNLQAIFAMCVDIDIDALIRGHEYIAKNHDEERDIDISVYKELLTERDKKIQKLMKENALLRREVNRLAAEKQGYAGYSNPENKAAEP